MTDEGPGELEQRGVEAVKAALNLVCVLLPHLAGLAYLVRVNAGSRVPTISVSASGRLLVNPAWFLALSRREAAFVVAHELLHLALRTHQRAGPGEERIFNLAHDFIINDLLSEALQCPPPADGLSMPGASRQSVESLVDQLKRAAAAGESTHERSWSAAKPGQGEPGPPETALGAALAAAGLAPPAAVDQAAHGLDVLPTSLERAWFPEDDPIEVRAAEVRVRQAAAKSLSLELLRERIERRTGDGEQQSGDEAVLTTALRALYRVPWEAALQQWLEAVAPGPRSYSRPSRRGADRTDVVLAGRRREGWTLHLVLDTSGSMEEEFGRVLGAISTFCEGVGVTQVHLLQCDVDVTADELVEVEQLAAFKLAGLGGSDLSPALHRLAEDPEVEAAVVLTDGWIDYPREPMPYQVLWVLTQQTGDFEPPYGQVLVLEQAG